MKKIFYQTNFNKTKINLNQIYLNKNQIKLNYHELQDLAHRSRYENTCTSTTTKKFVSIGANKKTPLSPYITFSFFHFLP